MGLYLKLYVLSRAAPPLVSLTLSLCRRPRLIIIQVSPADRRRLGQSAPDTPRSPPPFPVTSPQTGPIIVANYAACLLSSPDQRLSLTFRGSIRAISTIMSRKLPQVACFISTCPMFHFASGTVPGPAFRGRWRDRPAADRSTLPRRIAKFHR